MINVAIDGPAGAGKSTIARRAAADLGYIYVDTGAMFRALGLYMKRKGVDLDDTAAIASRVDEADIDIRYVSGTQCVILNGENVNDSIRTEEISNAASKVAVVGEVRKKMLILQRGIAAKHDVIMDGRDIGSAVLPDADIKIYLTASVDVRAERRYKENISKGMDSDLEEIKKDIRERDERDMNRKEAPLVKVADATEIDTSFMTIDEVVEKIEGMIRAIRA
ncbi:MAG: (d)CMP kinase [Lachnospiraceae bacterium]|nr:(d)CMP kinase [Lachnospiraceae bacterium]